MAEGPTTPIGAYPQVRLRRLRRHDWTRRLVRETRLTVDDLIWPIFVGEGSDARTPIAAMPGVDRLTIPALVDAAGEAKELGIPVIALFPAVDPAKKTPTCEEAWNSESQF